MTRYRWLILLSSVLAFSPSPKQSGGPPFSITRARAAALRGEWEAQSNSDTGGGESDQPSRKLSPLEQALLADGPTGPFVKDGWVNEAERDARYSEEAEFMSSKQHFESFNRIPEILAIDKFLSIDEYVDFCLLVSFHPN